VLRKRWSGKRQPQQEDDYVPHRLLLYSSLPPNP
jgi:hypothetical protein